MPKSTPISTPHPELDPASLNKAFRAFQADPEGLISIQFDGRALGSHVMVDGARVDIDVVHVSERDLWLIHDLDASRFGRKGECEICKVEDAHYDAVRLAD